MIARVYYDAFQIAITHDDQALASIFAKRGYEMKVMISGEDSPEAQKVKGFMEVPARHVDFGESDEWETSKRLIREGLDAEEFEKWLWRKRVRILI